MAERLIDVEALKERIEDNCCANCYNCGGVLCSCCKVDDVFCVIEDAPTIEAKPVVHAHWKKWGCQGTVCSNCHGRVLYECDGQEEKSKFCPHCSATMDE